MLGRAGQAGRQAPALHLAAVAMHSRQLQRSGLPTRPAGRAWLTGLARQHKAGWLHCCRLQQRSQPNAVCTRLQQDRSRGGLLASSRGGWAGWAEAGRQQRCGLAAVAAATAAKGRGWGGQPGCCCTCSCASAPAQLLLQQQQQQTAGCKGCSRWQSWVGLGGRSWRLHLGRRCGGGLTAHLGRGAVCHTGLRP